jgi:hypothetical protein
MRILGLGGQMGGRRGDPLVAREELDRHRLTRQRRPVSGGSRPVQRSSALVRGHLGRLRVDADAEGRAAHRRLVEREVRHVVSHLVEAQPAAEGPVRQRRDLGADGRRADGELLRRCAVLLLDRVPGRSVGAGGREPEVGGARAGGTVFTEENVDGAARSGQVVAEAVLGPAYDGMSRAGEDESLVTERAKERAEKPGT